jgi:hypothetical protein
MNASAAHTDPSAVLPAGPTSAPAGPTSAPARPTNLPAGFDPGSRVWIYQGHRPFTSLEATQTRHLLDSFIHNWQSHGTPVKGYAAIFQNQFIILMADETASGVSGCSTDSSVRLIRQIEQQTDIRLFDRLDLAFFIDGKIELISVAKLPHALKTGRLSPETPYFNNTIQTKEELEFNWPTQLKNSWLATKYLNQPTAPSTTSGK